MSSILNMVNVSFFILLSALHVAGDVTGTADIPEDVYDFCPLTSYPHRPLDAYKGNDSYVACCSTCVSEHCGLRAPCCPDEILAHMTAVCTSVLHSTGWISYELAEYKQYFWMVDSCLAEFHGSSLEQHCQSRNRTNAFDIRFVRPMIDNDTKIIYINEFCARCNGVQNESLNREFFEPKVRCPSNKETVAALSSRRKLAEMMTTGQCVYHMIPSDLDVVRESECRPADYSSCNSTGLWATYDEKIDNACSAYDLPYIFISYMVYKNIHCYYCNTNNASEKTDVCVRGGSHMFGFPTFTLSVILGIEEIDRNGQVTDRPAVVEGREACSLVQFYDPKHSTCRDVICPASKVLTVGGCVQIFTSFENILWHVNILWVVTPEDSGDNVGLIDGLTKLALNNLRKAFLLNLEDTINPLDTFVFAEDPYEDSLLVLSSMSFQYTGYLYSNPGPQLIKGFKENREIERKQTINGTTVKITETLMSEGSVAVLPYEARVFNRKLNGMYADIIENRYKYTFDMVTISKTHDCDLVRLNEEEYSLSVIGILTLLRNGLVLSNVEYDSDIYRNGVYVCVEDFLYPETRSSFPTQFSKANVQSVVSNVMGLVSVVFLF